jgi:hypothetical protein
MKSYGGLLWGFSEMKRKENAKTREKIGNFNLNDGKICLIHNVSVCLMIKLEQLYVIMWTFHVNRNLINDQFSSFLLLFLKEIDIMCLSFES